MPIYLLDDSLKFDVFYDPDDTDYGDDICISMYESCPEEERILRAEETNIYLTPKQATQLAQALLKAVESSLARCDCEPGE